MISFDPDKGKANIKKHGVSLAKAELMEWDEAFTWQDDRRDYGEVRLVALAPIDDRLYCCVYVERGVDKRIISLRKANNREKVLYASISDD
jgi:hypothetical protein